MMKKFAGILFILFLLACGSPEPDQQLKDPSEVQPPEDAIPDTTKIVNDSVIVPDTPQRNH